MICHWAQELLGYQYTVVHGFNMTMVNVDSLTRRFIPLIAHHCMIASILQKHSEAFQPLAYDASTFHNEATFKLSSPSHLHDPIPILNSSFISSTSTGQDHPVTTDSNEETPNISYSPVLYFTAKDDLTPLSKDSSAMRILSATQSFFSDWCIDDILGSQLLW